MRKVFEVLRPKSHCESVRPVVTLRPAMTRLTCLALALAAASVVLAAPKSASAASVKWRVQLPGQYILQRPVAGPDGNIAVVTSTGAVYSLAPNGAVRWVVPGVAGDSAPSFAPDGTVYVGSMNRITAISPKGVIRWTFTEPSSGQGVIAGPNVGPDGNIYVVSDFGGLGAYALSPSGQLLWSNPGDPSFIEYGRSGPRSSSARGGSTPASTSSGSLRSRSSTGSRSAASSSGLSRSAAPTTSSCSASGSPPRAPTAAST
jgi:hypothetical protein